MITCLKTACSSFNSTPSVVAMMLAALRARSMWHTTLLIFHSDNGAAPNGFQGGMGSNMPLRGTKATSWEGGVRGVAIVRGPPSIVQLAPGSRNHQLIHVADLYFSLPGLAARLNGGEELLAQLLADQPPFLAGDGLELWDAISANKQSPRTAVS